MSDIIPHGLERSRRAGKEAEEEEQEKSGGRKRRKKSRGESKRIGVHVRVRGAKLKTGKIGGREESHNRENVEGASS